MGTRQPNTCPSPNLLDFPALGVTSQHRGLCEPLNRCRIQNNPAVLRICSLAVPAGTSSPGDSQLRTSLLAVPAGIGHNPARHQTLLALLPTTCQGSSAWSRRMLSRLAASPLHPLSLRGNVFGFICYFPPCAAAEIRAGGEEEEEAGSYFRELLLSAPR